MEWDCDKVETIGEVTSVRNKEVPFIQRFFDNLSVNLTHI